MMQDASDVLAGIHIGLREIIKPGVDMWDIEQYVRRVCKEKMPFHSKSAWMKGMLTLTLMRLVAA